MPVTVSIAADRRAEKEQQLLHDDVEVRRLVLDAVAKATRGVSVADSLVSGEITRTIEGASQVSVVVHDQARAILRSGVLEDDDGDLQAVDIHLDGLWFRLAKVAKQGDDIVLAFEDRDVAYLRGKKGPRKSASRAKTTRAEYVLQLVRSVKRRRIPVRINELNLKQPIAKLTESERDDRRSGKESNADAARRAGFPEGTAIRGLNSRQIKRIGRCIRTVQEIKGVGEREVLAMLVAMAQESQFGEVTGVRGTTFQTLMIPESQLETQAKHFMLGGRSFRDGAIKTIRDHPTWTVGMVAVWVENPGPVSTFHASYDAHMPLARRILDKWGGIDSSGQKVETYRKRYAFKVDKGETYWDAIQRLAAEVNWRAFFTGGVFYYISEEDLFKSRARYHLSEDSEGVDNIDFDHDYRKKVSRATATVRINRWAVPPGIVVTVGALGPANGRWLVESTTRQLFSSEAVITLKKPLREKKEPRTELVTKKGEKGTNSPGGGGSVPAVDGVAAPIEHILSSANGWYPGHDGVDLISGANATIYAICDAKVIDVRAGGWWGKNPTGNISIGDGIIQLECLVNVGPFRKGMHFGYGHAEKSRVKVGDTVQAGQAIGKTGFANAWHVHFMVNGGSHTRGTGDRDPMPFVRFAQRHAKRGHTPGANKKDPEYSGANP